MRATLLHSPSAGKEDHSADQLLDALRAAGYSPRYRTKADGDDFLDVLREPTDLVVVAGGDGTVAKVMLALPDRNVPLAILPLGSANNIARSLGIEGSSREIAQGWKTAVRRRYDLGSTRGPWGYRLFVEAVGFGALARAVARADETDISGPETISLGRKKLRKVLKTAKPIKLEVAVDGRTLGDDLLLVEILNIPLTGPRLRLAPMADPSDALLDVAYVRTEQRADMLAWLAAPEDSTPPVTIAQGKKVVVAGTKTVLRIDDKPFEGCGRHHDTTVEIERDGLTVLTPATPGDPSH